MHAKFQHADVFRQTNKINWMKSRNRFVTHKLGDKYNFKNNSMGVETRKNLRGDIEPKNNEQ